MLYVQYRSALRTSVHFVYELHFFVEAVLKEIARTFG